jgi:agmatinase
MLAFPREEDIINFDLEKNNTYFHLLGFPFDENSVNPEVNTKLFPKVVRDLSFRIYSTLFADIRKAYILDHGDFKSKELIEEKIIEIDKQYKEKNNIFLFLGGNHLMTYYTFKALNKLKKIDVVISFDAHPDVYYDELNNSSFFRYLLKEYNFELILLGISNSSYEELDFLNNRKIIYYTSLEFEEDYQQILKEINKKIKGKNIYITTDLDVFKNNIASFQPEILGIEPKNYLEFLKNLNVDKLIGLDFVEFDPSKDINNAYSLMATRIILESIAIFNKKLNK